VLKDKRLLWERRGKEKGRRKKKNKSVTAHCDKPHR